MYNFNFNQFESHKQSENKPENARKGLKNVKLSLSLPDFEYDAVKDPYILLNEQATNGNRFNTMYDALRYIKMHCMFHYGKFNKSLAKRYIIDCAVYDPYVDSYIIQTNYDIKEFDIIYKRAYINKI